MQEWIIVNPLKYQCIILRTALLCKNNYLFAYACICFMKIIFRINLLLSFSFVHTFYFIFQHKLVNGVEKSYYSITVCHCHIFQIMKWQMILTSRFPSPISFSPFAKYPFLCLHMGHMNIFFNGTSCIFTCMSTFRNAFKLFC